MCPSTGHGTGARLGTGTLRHVFPFGIGIFYLLLAMKACTLLGGKFCLWVQAMKALLTFTPPPFNFFPSPLGHGSQVHLGKYIAVPRKNGTSPNWEQHR